MYGRVVIGVANRVEIEKNRGTRSIRGLVFGDVGLIKGGGGVVFVVELVRMVDRILAGR